ncbi:hypothetical protein [Alkalihalobacterium sp. APHAB7]|uniref:hypothetical protein n=1 Tax=Alkalihalobacterium sp. APHAB7 TaxID=3402081 RepID=UPI003AAE7001
MNLQLELKEIDLKAFLETASKDGEELMTTNVFSISSPKKFEFDEENSESAEELYKQLIENGKYVYVNFSSNAIYKELDCIDGHTYVYISEDEVEEHFEEDVPADFQPYENLRIYEDSSLGYLLNYNAEKVTIQSAVIQVTESSIDVVDDAELFEKPMLAYVQRFMK